jgi:hypothetical protein
MATWPRRMVIEVSLRLHPASASTRLTAAMSPGRSRPNTETAKRPWARHLPSRYSHGADWMVLPLKVMSRVARLAPLSAATPVGWPPPPVAQIRLSWTW